MNCYKKILIISANPLSTISNNGKTIASFFDSYPKDLIAQLYFSSAEPDSDICSSYFRISDMDMLRSRLFREKRCGKVVAFNNVGKNSNLQNDSAKTAKIKKNNFTRLLRETLWNDNWITNDLICWLDSFRPELIFFVAGDGIFSYKITDYIRAKYKTKLAIYITDDYILPRVSLSIIWWIRRNLIFHYMKREIQGSDAFFTISPTMQEKYRSIFGRDSFIAANMVAISAKSNLERKSYHRNTLELTYAGGLHLNRDKTLALLAEAVDEINKRGHNDKKIILKIYSNQKLSAKERNKIEIEGSSMFGGGLSADELALQLRQTDFLVHVESFRYKNVCDTRLSLSTKIPEYMSFKKPIIAIGPENIASMRYISDCACCITKKKEIKTKLRDYLENEDLQKKCAEKAYVKYINNHNKVNNQEKFFEILENI